MNSYREIKQCIVGIPKNKPIIIAGHENADMDSIGSSLAMAYFLEKIGKKDVSVLIEKKDMYKIHWFKNEKFITNNIQKNDYVFIMVDLNRKKRLGKFEAYFDNADFTINIDHHESNKEESNYIISDENISSTCEMLFNLMNEFDTKIDKNIAELLYAGILTDTTGFSHRLTPKTFAITSKLLECGVDYKYITKKVFLERTMKEAKALSKILNKISLDVFHYVIIDRKDPVFSDLEYSMLFKKMVPILKNIEEVKVLGIFLIDEGRVFGEFKSNVDIDLSKLAIKFGGGGHKDSAGFESELPIEDILEISKEYIRKNSIVLG